MSTPPPDRAFADVRPQFQMWHAAAEAAAAQADPLRGKRERCAIRAVARGVERVRAQHPRVKVGGRLSIAIACALMRVYADGLRSGNREVRDFMGHLIREYLDRPGASDEDAAALGRFGRFIAARYEIGLSELVDNDNDAVPPAA